MINKKHIAKFFTELIGYVEVKGLFNGYGVYSKDKHLFGIVQNNTFYLRAKDNLAKMILSKGAKRCSINNANAALSIKNYYSLPSEILNDKETLKKFVLLAIKQVKEEKSSTSDGKSNRIKDLPNLSFKHELILSKINIHSVQQLKEIGVIHAYILLRETRGYVSLTLLWLLYAALKRTHVSLLTVEEKELLFKELNLVLAKKGLRPETKTF